jgi:O-antigen/teichoic acid export membrane protein
MNKEGLFLLYAMGISFFLSSLKTIPSIMLEREIQFNKLIIPQILETLVFNFVAVYFAWKGFGISAFTYAVLSRGVVGLVAVYYVYPWKPLIGIYRQSLRSLLRFGLPYQANTFLAVLKDDGMTILLTKIIGTSGLGYIGWASKWAGLPLRVVMDNLSKVSFPTFARLQNDKEKLTRAVEINLKYTLLAIFPLLILMAFIAKPLAMQIPRYQKWLPAIIPLYLYLYSSMPPEKSKLLSSLCSCGQG